MRPKGILTLVVLVLLCLPSVLGMTALLYNAAIHRAIGDWGTASSVFVAITRFFGMPLTLLAIVVCGATLLAGRIPPRIKSADVAVLGVGVLANLFVTFWPLG